jgi:hypothetical protein
MQILDILCLRDPTRGDATSSYLMVDGEFFCHVLEDRVAMIDGAPANTENIKGRPVSSWKVARQTAIPEGVYDMTIERSPRFQKDMMSLKPVPAFDGIRVHGGLKPEHTEGCPLLGDELYETDAGPRVKDGKSTPAVERLFRKVADVLARGGKVRWTVRTNQNVMKEAA